MVRSLATDVIVKGSIKTVEARAKEIKRHAEKMITLAKKNTLFSRRRAATFIRPVEAKNKKTALQYLFDVIGPRYKDRNGGYTRIIKAPNRPGDNSKMVILELV